MIKKFALWWLSLIPVMLTIGACTSAGKPLEPGRAREFQPSGLGNPSHGERIYFTGTNQDGNRIRFRQGPDFGGMMMGRFLTCAACHGPEAHGGEHMMHMQWMDAPDITYSSLSGESGEHEEIDEHEDDNGDYSIDEFRLAVVGGKHPDGEPLSKDMPRWQMSEEDLLDLFAFLKSISN